MKKIITILLSLIILMFIGFGLQTFAYDQSYNLWLFKVNIFGHYVRMVDFLISSIFVSISLMLILSIFIFGNRKRLEKQKKLKDKYFPLYQSKLLEYLGNPAHPYLDIKKDYSIYFKNTIRGKYTRQLLIDQFCDLNMYLPKEKSKQLEELYREIGLHKYTYRKVHSMHWHKKIQGFKELYAMDITEKNKILYKYINSKNDLVRIEAQIALVDLSKENPNANPFDFLGKLKSPFSLWEQITLHQVMVQRNITPPDFGQWILSKNESVSMFCLRMIREYKQTHNSEKIQILFGHQNEDIRKLAIQVSGDLKLTENMKILKNRYKHETPENALEIIKSFAKLGDPSFIEFLQLVIDKEDSANLQIEALRAIRNCGDPGELALQKMLKSDYKDYNIIIKHVMDKRIV